MIQKMNIYLYFEFDNLMLGIDISSQDTVFMKRINISDFGATGRKHIAQIAEKSAINSNVNELELIGINPNDHVIIKQMGAKDLCIFSIKLSNILGVPISTELAAMSGKFIPPTRIL